MKDSIKFRRYAEDCRRLAKQMKPEYRATLLEIAEAWDRCAQEAARGGDQDKEEDTEEPAPRCRSACGKQNRAGRPPPGTPSLRSMAGRGAHVVGEPANEAY